MARRSSGTRSQLIHCDNCDEEYSATYKRCPFCGARPDNGGMDLTARFTGLGGGKRAADAREDNRSSSRGGRRAQPREEEEEYEDDYVFDGGDVFDDEDGDYEEDDEYYTRRGGKRLIGGGISPTTIAGIAFSAVLFIAAILIVALVIVPMVRDGSTEPATNDANTSLPGTSSVSPDVPDSPLPSVPAGEDPNAPASTAPVDDPNGTTTTIPAGQTATGFTVSPTDFTISDKWPAPVTIKVTFSPAGSTGTITWTTSNANVATVDANGVVTAVGKGNCTITASMPGAADRTCRVGVTKSVGSAPAASSSPAPSGSPAPSSSPAPSGGSLSLNKTDISINNDYPDPVTLRASGGSGTTTWSSSNTGVATVDANGKVTRVGKGTCTITATDGAGNSAECIVRCGGM